jgi:hypothetical protein
MKKLNLLLIVVFAVLFSNQVHAQQTIISVDTVYFPYDSAYCCGQSYSLNVKLKNLSNVAYTGSFELLFRTDKMVNNQDSSQVFYQNPVLTINALDSAIVTATGFVFDTTSSFRIGGNIVVVWPRSVTGTVIQPDSFTTYINVMQLTGINDQYEHETGLITFPNPVNNTLFITDNDLKNPVEEVRIFDILGHLVLKTPFVKGFYDVSNYKNGVYILQIRRKNGNISTSKIILKK